MVRSNTPKIAWNKFMIATESHQYLLAVGIVKSGYTETNLYYYMDSTGRMWVPNYHIEVRKILKK